jgi:hypothetical protein
MDWCAVDERLIRCGELLLSLDFLEDYDYELSLLNDGKVWGAIQDYVWVYYFPSCPIPILHAI